MHEAECHGSVPNGEGKLYDISNLELSVSKEEHREEQNRDDPRSDFDFLNFARE